MLVCQERVLSRGLCPANISHSLSQISGCAEPSRLCCACSDKHLTRSQSDCSRFGSFHGLALPSAHACRHAGRDPSAPLLRAPAQPQDVSYQPPHAAAGSSPTAHPAVSGHQDESPMHGPAGARRADRALYSLPMGGPQAPAWSTALQPVGCCIHCAAHCRPSRGSGSSRQQQWRL